MKPTIVLIHGLWMTPLSWELWIARFQAQGYDVLAPSWPGMEADVAQLRRDPSPIAAMSVGKILDHYEQAIRGLEHPPIIMGHSFGGAFVQVLLGRGLAAAGVGINAATVRGVRDLPLSTVRSASSLLRNPFLRHKAIELSESGFRYAFGNTLTEQESRAAWERYHVPGSRNVLLEGAFCNFNPRTALNVDFAKSDRAPLLFIAGGRDHVVPASVNRSNAAKYTKSGAITELKEFPGRSHFTVGQAGWEAVADYALNWAVEHAAPVTNGASLPRPAPAG
jgi:pimeloyl-ACP methyl ester carboxylesterase